MELVDIPKLLKEERTKRFMTYEDVANGLDCSASYVFRIEKGKRKKPSYEIVSRMINFFELTDEDLKKYINNEDIQDYVPKKEEIQIDILNFIKNMDINNFSEVSELLNRIKDYQGELVTNN